MARLTDLWEAGKLSAAEIGKLLNCSKNAVIGKAGRMGLSARQSPIKPRDCGARPRAIRIKRAPAATLPSLIASATVEPARPVESAPVALVRTCQFPLWSRRQRPTHRYCDAPCKGSWCATHRAVVFTSAQPKALAA